MKPGLFRIRILDTLAEIECSPIFNDLFRSRPGALMDNDTHRWIITTATVELTKTWLEHQGHTVVILATRKPPPTPAPIHEQPPAPPAIPPDWLLERIALLRDIRARALAGQPINPDRDEARMQELIRQQHQRTEQA